MNQLVCLFLNNKRQRAFRRRKDHNKRQRGKGNIIERPWYRDEEDNREEGHRWGGEASSLLAWLKIFLVNQINMLHSHAVYIFGHHLHVGLSFGSRITEFEHFIGEKNPMFFFYVHKFSTVGNWECVASPATLHLMHIVSPKRILRTINSSLRFLAKRKDKLRVDLIPNNIVSPNRILWTINSFLRFFAKRRDKLRVDLIPNKRESK